MDPLLLFKALILGIVEGLTEFLPISSTGHLILVGDLLDFNDNWGKAFEIIIQFGAILAVCWEYRKRLMNVTNTVFTSRQSQKFVLHIIIACLPAMGLGLVFGKFIKAHLFSPIPVAIAFIVGALIIFWAEYRQTRSSTVKRINSIDQLTALDALKVGLAQCAALIPGTSRSGATIIGGLLFGLSRKAAAEFSFFLAIPVMFAATLLDVVKNRDAFAAADMPIFATGFVVSFVSALLVIRALMKFISKHDFTVFAWYRIGFGGFILLTAAMGWINWSA